MSRLVCRMASKRAAGGRERWRASRVATISASRRALVAKELAACARSRLRAVSWRANCSLAAQKP
eukprot:6720898-Prorocentrum_lima.AAC.1